MRLLPWDYAVRNLSRKPLRLVLSLAGATMIVLLVIAAAAFVRGMERTLAAGTDARNIILLGAGSEESLERSEINPATGGIAAADIAGLKMLLGVPFVSPEIHMATLVKEDPAQEAAYLTLLRGVTPEAFLVHRPVRITEGRAPGSGEILVGKLAGVKMGLAESRLAVGKPFWFDGRSWTISGRFEAPSTVMEAEIWLPLQDLKVAARRDTLSCVVLTLDTAEPSDVELFCKRRLDLELAAIRETDYYGQLFEFYRPIRTITWITALLIASGALFGGLNIMYASFASRVRELAALQAVGFSRFALIVSLMQESLLAAAGGALLALAFAIVSLEGMAVRMSMGAFSLHLDGYVLSIGFLAALFLGLCGSLPPAWRCLRMPIADGLKAS